MQRLLCSVELVGRATKVGIITVRSNL